MSQSISERAGNYQRRALESAGRVRVQPSFKVSKDLRLRQQLVALQYKNQPADEVLPKYTAKNLPKEYQLTPYKYYAKNEWTVSTNPP